MTSSAITTVSASPLDAYLPFLMVFGGCCLAMVFFEKALKQDPGSGNFLTFTELCFIALENLPRRFIFGRKNEGGGSLITFQPLVAARSDHLKHAVLFVSMSWLVNYAFSFNIAVPIHTVVRSCNVVATLLIGFFFFRCTYSKTQCVASVLVTIGILLATLADAKVVAACQNVPSVWQCLFPQGVPESGAAGNDSFLVWLVGIQVLLLCLVTQSFLGHIQRNMYDPYLQREQEPKVSKNELAEEFLYTSSIASLLGCVVFWDEIKLHWGNAWASPAAFTLDLPAVVPSLMSSGENGGNNYISVSIPLQWCYILANNVAQACCLKGVFYLSTRYSALTVNITLSMRKFFTVVFSILYFQNPWSLQHSVAALFVFGGGLLYSSGELLFSSMKRLYSARTADEDAAAGADISEKSSAIGTRKTPASSANDGSRNASGKERELNSSLEMKKTK
ncbi:unnamed protein product [Amoebophrya sp. A120]|nr:unnamed protein product [Amoebophrya sp. A120]|eukprot:GSA120T00006499001.1